MPPEPPEKLLLTELWCREGTSDKVYNVWLEEEQSGPWFIQGGQRIKTYRLCYSYGRRGANLQTGAKTTGLRLGTARNALANLVADKRGRGYKDINLRVEQRCAGCGAPWTSSGLCPACTTAGQRAWKNRNAFAWPKCKRCGRTITDSASSVLCVLCAPSPLAELVKPEQSCAGCGAPWAAGAPWAVGGICWTCTMAARRRAAEPQPPAPKPARPDASPAFDPYARIPRKIRLD